MKDLVIESRVCIREWKDVPRVSRDRKLAKSPLINNRPFISGMWNASAMEHNHQMVKTLEHNHQNIIIIISEIDTSLNLCVTLVMHLIQKDGEDIKTGTQIWLECGRV